jgi:hypothetical protein
MDKIFKHNIKDMDLNPLIEYAYYLKECGLGGVGKKSNINGFQTKEIYEADTIVVPLFDYVSNIINTECKEVFDLIELELGYYWININGNGSYNENHHHMGGVSNGKKQSILSGVFYLSVPDGDCGDIVFSNKEGKEVSVKPKNNDLLLFSPALVHRVEKNNTNEERISIAFNYIKSRTQKINNIL